jgi:MFS family permease
VASDRPVGPRDGPASTDRAAAPDRAASLDRSAERDIAAAPERRVASPDRAAEPDRPVASPDRSLRAVRALRHRNYRLFFVGQGTSLVGTWLTRLAIGYETYALSHSAFQLGLVAFFGQAPTSLVAPFAGVLVDRWDRRRTLVVTQILALLQSAALAFFALTHTMTVWHLVVLGAVQAIINAFDMPARQSFLGRMVADRADLPNAIALNSALVNGARLLGPVVGAVLIDLVGVGWCFAIDATSYVAVIASLLAMRVNPEPGRGRPAGVLTELREGLAYVRGVPLVASLLLLLAVTSVFGGAYSSLLPAVAEDTMHGGPRALGWLMGAAGAGALMGTIYLARRETVVGLDGVVARCGIGIGLGLIAMELAPKLWMAMPVLFVVGLSLIVQWAATNTLVQTLSAPDKLGRVMSLYAVAFFGGAPIGALILGTLAGAVGPIHAFAIAGAGCLVSSYLFRRALPGLREVSRPRYVELGLINP